MFTFEVLSVICPLITDIRIYDRAGVFRCGGMLFYVLEKHPEFCGKHIMYVEPRYDRAKEETYLLVMLNI